jgi:hypothetical protein
MQKAQGMQEEPLQKAQEEPLQEVQESQKEQEGPLLQESLEVQMQKQKKQNA